jgi:LacI family transcriptional regulator, galactose operon repressor
MLRIGIQLDFAGGYGRSVLKGVMQYANLRTDWEFVMPPMYSLKSKKLIDPRTADGVIVMVHAARSIEPFRRQRIPVVNTARTLSAREIEQQYLPTILPDDAAVGRMAYRYFFERGFRSFGFCGHPTASWSRVRRDAFAAECRRDKLFFTSASLADGAPHEWIRSLPRPCAVLGANDRFAWHVIDACRENTIAVPEDIAVLGVDNDSLLTEMVRPTLSSIDLGAERIGFQAAKLLEQLMRHPDIQRAPMEIPPFGVVTRHSTEVLSIDDQAVAESVRFIREHAFEAMTIEDVLKHVAMSRRNLERRFRRCMQRTLLDEIRRVRLDRAAGLLRETDLDMLRVAEQSGFANQVRFSTVFRERMGDTPTGYRRRHRPAFV